VLPLKVKPDAPPAQQSQPEQQQSPQQKQNSLPGSAEHQRKVDDALNSESGPAGKAEPLQAKSDDSVLMNGAWNSWRAAGLKKRGVKSVRVSDTRSRRLGPVMPMNGPAFPAHAQTAIVRARCVGVFAGLQCWEMRLPPQA
jgi:hypothetical protein